MFKKLFNLQNGLFCVSKHKVGEIGIVVTRNVGTNEEYLEDYGTHDLFETRLTALGKIANKLASINSAIKQTNLTKEV
jgi:hypothetical protein